MFGKTYFPSRQTAVYGDPGLSYRYSGKNREAAEWLPVLRSLKERVEEATDRRYNFVLCNLYPDGTAKLGFHSDDERDLVPEATIASLSFGVQRDFVLKNNADKSDRVKIKLGSGVLLTMEGSTQKQWKHTVPRRASVKDPRINLTFRLVKT